MAALALLAPLLAAMPGGSALADTRWTGTADSDWFNPANWTNGVPTGSGTGETQIVPTGATPAVIDGGAASAEKYTYIGSTRGGANGPGELRVINGGTLNAGNCCIYLGSGGGHLGSMTVDGAGSAVSAYIFVVGHYSGTGELVIQNGGSVTGDSLMIGRYDGGIGTATVTGTNSILSSGAYSDLLLGGESSGSTSSAQGTLNLLDGGAANVGTGNRAIVVANSYGSTGVLNIGNGGAPGIVYASSVKFGNGNGTLNFNHNNASYSFAAPITGNGTINILAGSTIFGATNSHSGETRVQGGELKAGDAGAFSSNSTFVVNGGTLDLDNIDQTVGGLSGTGGTVSLGTAALTVNQAGDTSYAGVISGTGGLTKSGVGALELTGANTYSGGTTVSGGTLVQGSAGAFSANTAYTINGGILDLNDFDLTASSLSGTGTLSLGNGALTIDQDTDTVFAGNLVSGNVLTTDNLIKMGDGTLSLTGSGELNGRVVVEGGTLEINGVMEHENRLVGRGAGSNGTLIVSGAGAVLGTLWGTNEYIGVSGTGHMTVSDGAQVHTDFTRLGRNATGDGTLSVDGDGSVYSYEREITIGEEGRGLLAVSGGATVQGRDEVYGASLIGEHQGASGEVLITGAGSKWVVDSEGIILGKHGEGVLTVADGGLLQTDQLRIADETDSVGVLNIGAAAAVGVVDADAISFGDGNGTINFNHTDTNYVFSAPVSGDGAINHLSGETRLTGDSSGFSGTTSLTGGHLRVDGSLGGALTVGAGATLSGTGTLGGSAEVSGTLSAGNSPGTLTIVGNLTLNPSSISVFELGAPGVVGGAQNDLVNVGGNLTLDGTLQASVGAAGYYRLFNYGAALAGSFDTETVTSSDVGFTLASHMLLTGMPGEVNLLALGAGQHMQFWDGGDEAGNGAVDGGSGTWDRNANWTGAPGSAGINDTWRGSVGVFAGAAGGTVTIGNPGSFDTLQFATDGYVLTGGDLIMGPVGTASTLNVDGGVTATIESAIVDGGSGYALVKAGTGKLILTGANSYSGGTTISAGTLQGNTASLQGDILNNAALVFDQGTNGTYAGIISGTGTFTKQGVGNLTISGHSTGFTGATNISDGTLTVSGTLGDDSGGANGSSLTVESGGTLSIGTSRHVNAASITNEAGGTINLGMEATLRGTGNTLNNSGVINVDDMGLITDAGAINNLAGGVINFAGEGRLYSDDDNSGGEDVVNNGTINLNGTNTQAVLVGRTSSNDLDNQSGGIINVNDGYLDVAGTLTNWSAGAGVGGPGGIDIGSNGRVEADTIFNRAGGEITNTGSFGAQTIDNYAGATLTSSNYIWTGSPTGLVNRGTLNAEGLIDGGPGDIVRNWDTGVFNVTGALDVNGGFKLNDNSTLNVTGGDLSVSGTLGHQSTAANGITIAAGRTLSADSVGIGDTFVNAVLLNNGTLTAANTITNIGTVQNNGTINGGVENWRSLTNTGILNDGLTVNDGTVTNTGIVNGPIHIAGGTFITYAGGQAGDISNQGSLVFDQAADGAYAGIISGSGSLTKQGTGALTLTQDSSAFAGITTVFGGELVVNGALGGILNMNGGTLGGSGSLGNVILESGARLTPGNSIGTMNVVNYTFNPGSIYEVELDDGGFTAGTNNDLLNATGTVNINGGTVHVTPENGTDDGSTYTPGTYTIITAATGVAGAGFDAVVTDDFAFLDFTLDYSTANQVDLISALSVTPVTGFCVPGMSLNQCAAGDGAFSMGAGNSVYDAVLTLSNAEAPVALDQLSGEIHASARTALLEDSRFLREAAMDRLRVALGGTAANDSAQIEKRISESFGLWGQGFGSWSQQGGNGNASGMDRSIGGFLMGGDAFVWDNMRFGVLGGYSRSGFSAGNLLSTGTADTYTLGAYGGGKWDAFALSGGLAHSWHSLDMSRSVAFTGFSDNLSVAYSARTLQAWGEAAYSFEAGASRFEPFANLAYVSHSTNSFTETGGAAALTSASNVVDATFATLGLRAETDVALGDMRARLHGMVGWRHAFGGAPTAQMTFASGGNAFTIVGAPLAQDSLVLNAGFDINLANEATLGIAYGGQFGSGIQNHSAKLNLNVRF